MEYIKSISPIININSKKRCIINIKNNNLDLPHDIKRSLFFNILNVSDIIFELTEQLPIECSGHAHFKYKGNYIELFDIESYENCLYLIINNKCYEIFNYYLLGISFKYYKLYNKIFAMPEPYAETALNKNTIHLGNFIIKDINNLLDLNIKSMFTFLLCCNNNKISKPIIYSILEFITF